MIICKLCNRQTEHRESTGKFETKIYIDPEDKSKGHRILNSLIVCAGCNGEKFVK